MVLELCANYEIDQQLQGLNPLAFLFVLVLEKQTIPIEKLTGLGFWIKNFQNNIVSELIAIC